MSLEYETILADPALKEPYVNNPGPTARGRQPHHDCQLRQELNNSSTLFNVSTLQRFILPFKCAFRDRRRVTFGEPLGGFPATPKTPNSLHSLGFCFKSGLNKTNFVRPSLKTKILRQTAEEVIAERGGFEPPVQLPIRQFSKLLV